MTLFRLMIVMGASIGLIGLLVHLITLYWIKRYNIFENNELSDLEISIDSLVDVVKLWKLYGLFKSGKLHHSRIVPAMKILRWVPASLILILVGITIQLTGMFGNAGMLW